MAEQETEAPRGAGEIVNCAKPPRAERQFTKDAAQSSKARIDGLRKAIRAVKLKRARPQS
jgi:hypothetical protein